MYWQWWRIPEALRIDIAFSNLENVHWNCPLSVQTYVTAFCGTTASTANFFFFFKMRHLREFFQARICTTIGIFGVPSYNRYSVFLIFLDSFIPQDVVQ